MSVRVYFAFGVRHRIQQAALTAAKNYRSAKKILVYSSEQKRLDGFSRMLWDVAPTAFVPHEQVESAAHLAQLIHEDWGHEQQPAPVLLVQDPSLLAASELAAIAQEVWLLNLDLACPPHYTQFACVLEIVSEHEQDKQYARNRWKHYRNDGANLIAHQMTSN